MWIVCLEVLRSPNDALKTVLPEECIDEAICTVYFDGDSDPRNTTFELAKDLSWSWRQSEASARSSSAEQGETLFHPDVVIGTEWYSDLRCEGNQTSSASQITDRPPHVYKCISRMIST